MWFPQLPLKEADGRGSQEVEEMGPLDCQWLVKSRSICQNETCSAAGEAAAADDLCLEQSTVLSSTGELLLGA